PVTLASECAIYARTASSQTFPYMRRDASATDIPVIPIKAFGECTVPGAVLTATSFTVTSVTRVGVGGFQFTFPGSRPATNVSLLCGMSSSGCQPIVSYTLPAKLSTSVVIQLISQDGTRLTDAATTISMAVL